MTNLDIEKRLAELARCDVRTARRALEHGYMTIRRRVTRENIALMLQRHPDLARQYSKEHYP